MSDLHLSPADVAAIRAHALGVASDALPEADRQFLEEMRRRQEEFEAAPDLTRITPTEDLRAVTEAYHAAELRCRSLAQIVTDLEKRQKWLLIAVFVLAALAVAGWRG